MSAFYKACRVALDEVHEGMIDISGGRNMSTPKINEIKKLTRFTTATYEKIAKHVGVSVYTVQRYSARPKHLVMKLTNLPRGERLKGQRIHELAKEYGMEVM